MTISLTTRMANNNFLFQQTAGANGASFTQLHIDMINRNPEALKVYEAAAASNTPYTIGEAGKGTFYDISALRTVIDPNDFTLIKTPAGSTPQAAAQNQLINAANVVVRGVHEGAHVIDNKDGTPIPGVTASYASPGEYATARAPTEGHSLATEARVDRAYIGQTYTINGVTVTYDTNTYIVGGNASTLGGYNDMDSRLNAVYSNTTLTSAQQTSAATAIATSANLTAIASTSGGTYLDTNMRDYAAHWSGLALDQISRVTQDDSGHWSVTALSGNDTVTRSYNPIEPWQSAPTITSEFNVSHDDEGFRLEILTNFETRTETRQVFDLNSQLLHRVTNQITSTGTKIVTTEDFVPNASAPVKVTTTEDVNADNIIDKTTTKLDADHNGIAERTTVAVNGGDTSVALDTNQNGSAESITTTHANKEKDLLQTDEAALAWTTISTHYDTLGRADTQRVNNDNASYTLNDWDQASVNATALTATNYDTLGRLDTMRVTDDDKSMTIKEWDRLAANQADMRLCA